MTCATGDYIWCIDGNVSLESEWSITKIANELEKAKTHEALGEDYDANRIHRIMFRQGTMSSMMTLQNLLVAKIGIIQIVLSFTKKLFDYLT